MYDPNCKVVPPLRSEDDRRALVAGLRDATLDCVVTNHQPRTLVDKLCEFDHVEPGMTGLETALASLMGLVDQGELSLTRLVRALTTEPARIFSLQGGTLKPGAPADLVVFQPQLEWTVTLDRLFSRGRNTPLAGAQMKGRVLLTVVGGDVVFQEAA